MSYTPDPAAVAIVAGLLSTIDFPPNVVHPVLMEPMAEAVIVALVTEGHMVDDATYTTCVQSLAEAVDLLRRVKPMLAMPEGADEIEADAQLRAFLAAQGGPDAITH